MKIKTRLILDAIEIAVIIVMGYIEFNFNLDNPVIIIIQFLLLILLGMIGLLICAALEM